MHEEENIYIDGCWPEALLKKFLARKSEMSTEAPLFGICLELLRESSCLLSNSHAVCLKFLRS